MGNLLHFRILVYIVFSIINARYVFARTRFTTYHINQAKQILRAKDKKVGNEHELVPQNQIPALETKMGNK